MQPYQLCFVDYEDQTILMEILSRLTAMGYTVTLIPGGVQLCITVRCASHKDFGIVKERISEVISC